MTETPLLKNLPTPEELNDFMRPKRVFVTPEKAQAYNDLAGEFGLRVIVGEIGVGVKSKEEGATHTDLPGDGKVVVDFENRYDGVGDATFEQKLANFWKSARDL